MSRRNKKGNKSSGSSGDEWIQTYSDTITLLLTFFILLYSMSSVDAQKFKNVSSALQSVLSGQEGETILEHTASGGNVPVEDINKGKIQGARNETKKLEKKVNEFVADSKLDGSVEVKSDSRGVILHLRENVIFASGNADIKLASKPILNKINSLIKGIGNDVIVEGHTDNVPIKNSKYDSNWELSTARAVNVLRYFVEVNKDNPDKFTAAGYGEYRPIAPNNNDANRSKNRCVNIVIVSKEGDKKNGR